jgi:hypothetical protein
MSMSIRAAILRFRDLHEAFKAGKLASKDDLARYESERDEFMRALLSAQQLTLRAGQSPRQALRVNRAERLVLMIGPRREGTLTVDLGVGGFAAQVGPLAARIVCDFELGTPPDVLRGRARVVASMGQPDGSCRTSFTIESMSNDDRKRLEVFVVDAALAAQPR